MTLIILSPGVPYEWSKKQKHKILTQATSSNLKLEDN